MSEIVENKEAPVAVAKDVVIEDNVSELTAVEAEAVAEVAKPEGEVSAEIVDKAQADGEQVSEDSNKPAESKKRTIDQVADTTLTEQSESKRMKIGEAFEDPVEESEPAKENPDEAAAEKK